MKHQYKDFIGNKYELGDLFFHNFSADFITGFTPCYLISGSYYKRAPEKTIKVSYIPKDSLAWGYVEHVFLKESFHKFCSDNKLIKERLFEI